MARSGANIQYDEEDIYDDDNEHALLLNEFPPPRRHKGKFLPNLDRKTLIRIVVICLGIAAAVTISLVNIFPDRPAAGRALAIFTLASLLWASEALPLYATSLLLPILIVVLRVMCDADYNPLGAKEAAAQVMGVLFSGTVLVAFGAFTMSAAFSKYNLSYRLATIVLSRVGKKPHIVMLALMFLGLFLSMWMNNVASPVVVVSVIAPMLQEFHAGDRYTKALLLGIAYSNNIGGMTTPISSPQNLIAYDVIVAAGKDISWGKWLAVSMPISIMCTLVVWIYLWLFFRPDVEEVDPVPERVLEPFSLIHVFVLIVCGGTIVLWAIGSQIESFVGSPGITALVPVVLFFGFHLLDKADFKDLPWDILMLLAGGLALGGAIKSSGLLDVMARSLASAVDSQGLWVITLAFTCFIWLFSNFISHTVAAIIILPVIADVGSRVGGGEYVALLVISGVLIDSGAMALPVSSFPNAQVYSLRDKREDQFVTAADFVKTGFILGILEIILLMGIGYFLLLWIL